VLALNAKVTVLEDHKTDVEKHFGNHQDSEGARVDLHGHIVKTGIQVEQDNISHTNHQNDLKVQI
jgi:hypothetical protein